MCGGSVVRRLTLCSGGAVRRLTLCSGGAVRRPVFRRLACEIEQIGLLCGGGVRCRRANRGRGRTREIEEVGFFGALSFFIRVNPQDR